ncbi:MAG: fumarylacetoacetate hydrolase family protein [Bacillota bacterium]|jgi:2-keto-4-pentenoate hydratase/2-oxohepta-3-ene-1,7-dioic acid hydratase in catechol pathway
MKIVRFIHDNIVSYGVLSHNTIRLIEGSIYEDYQELPVEFNLDQIKLLSPCEPSKIICIGLNYRDHALEVGLPIPKWPVIFMKPSTAVIGPEQNIIYPTYFVNRVDYEAELGVVIKKKAKNVDEEDALNYVLGYTCANDVTARNLQPKEGQWTAAKSFDTFMPLGPVIATDISPHNLNITCTVNGEIKQKSNTSNFIFPVPYLVSYISKIMTLLPGDVIITGTPSGISPVHSGDIITISIDGIGDLTNKIVKEC